MFCREQAVQLHRELPAIRERGAELVLVGNGNARWGRAFRDELQLTCPIYVDEKREAYAALGMKRSMAAALNFSTARHAARALSAGFKQTAVRGDTWQLGGVLVVRPGGEVAYEYLSEEPGDHPPVAEVLAALKPRRSR